MKAPIHRLVLTGVCNLYYKNQAYIQLFRAPTSSGNHGKPGKSLKKSSMHGKIMEFEKSCKIMGKSWNFVK